MEVAPSLEGRGEELLGALKGDLAEVERSHPDWGKARYGQAIYTEFGFLDSFNPTLTGYRGRLQHGRIVPGTGWVDGESEVKTMSPSALVAAVTSG